jgi:hypothetical protein
MKIMNSGIKGLAILLFINHISFAEFSPNIVKAEVLKSN